MFALLYTSSIIYIYILDFERGDNFDILKDRIHQLDE